ncbi:guanine nucleotide-binding protein subunit beta-2-like 1 protein, partial [Pancytospora epiphaga]
KIVSVSADNTMIIWDKNTKEHLTVHGHNRKITSVAIDQASNKLVTTSEDGTFIVWNSIGEQVAVFGKGMENSHRGWINKCGFVPNVIDQLVTVSEDGTVKIWDLITETLLKTFIAGHYVDYMKAKETKIPVKDYDVDSAVKAISFSKDGSLLAYGGRNSKVYIVNLLGNETLQTIDVPAKVIALASGVNQPLLAISIPNKILLWHIVEDKLIGEYVFAQSGEHYCYSLVFVGDEIVAGIDNGDLLRIEMPRN